MMQQADPRNADVLVGINGVLVARAEARISPFDSSVQAGDAVWEGLRVYGGRVYGLAEHLSRLHDSAKALGFAEIPTATDLRTQLGAVLEANNMIDDVHVRLTVTRGEKVTSGMDPRLNQSGPTIIILAEHKAPVYGATPITLMTSSVRRPAPDVLDPKIHHANLLPSILAKMEATAAGADDAIMLDQNGFVAETNATNLFLVRNGHVFTPLAEACPEGVTRATLLVLCGELGIATHQARLSLMEFYRADEVFCTGTMGEVVAVARIDGRRIGSDAPGPVTARLAPEYMQHVRAHAEKVHPKRVG